MDAKLSLAASAFPSTAWERDEGKKIIISAKLSIL
jgi:hypothetical protein